MIYGYARVSTSEQETSLQIDALRRSGVRRIYTEKTSSIGKRPELQRLLSVLKAGDVVVVYKLDRLARSLKDLLGIIDRLESLGAGFKSLTEPIDTSSPAGRLMVQVLGAVAEFERSLIRERSIAGQVAALERGAVIGRPRKLTHEQCRQVYDLWKLGIKKAELRRIYNASWTTIDLAIDQFEDSGRKKRPIRPVLGPLLASSRKSVK